VNKLEEEMADAAVQLRAALTELWQEKRRHDDAMKGILNALNMADAKIQSYRAIKNG